MGNEPSPQVTEYKAITSREPAVAATIELDVSWRGDDLVIAGKDYMLLKSLQQEACKFNEAFNLRINTKPCIQLTWQVPGCTKDTLTSSVWRYRLEVVFNSSYLETVISLGKKQMFLGLIFGCKHRADIYVFGSWIPLTDKPRMEWNETEVIISM